MAGDEIELDEFRANFKGICHFQEWYKLLYDWLIRNGYRHTESNDENFEEYINELILPGGTAKNNWVWWRVQKKRTDMFQFFINIDIQTIVMVDKEVIVNGKKFKANDVEINLLINARLVVDPNGKWKDKGIASEFWDFLKRNQFHTEIEEEKYKLYQETQELYDRAKQALGLPTMEPRNPYFIQEGAYPDL